MTLHTGLSSPAQVCLNAPIKTVSMEALQIPSLLVLHLLLHRLQEFKTFKDINIYTVMHRDY